jgi:hypothetical protein
VSLHGGQAGGLRYHTAHWVEVKMSVRQFQSYEEFFAFYVQQHSNLSNRLMHAAGTTLGIATAIAAFVLGHPWFALLWIPIAYGFAWTGHFLLEKNTPATFGHPFWSFISDFRMLFLMATGRLGSYLKESPGRMTT